MNKKQARERAKHDVACMDVGGFDIVALGIGVGNPDYTYTAVGGPANATSPAVVEQWRFNRISQKWEKRR